MKRANRVYGKALNPFRFLGVIGELLQFVAGLLLGWAFYELPVGLPHVALGLYLAGAILRTLIPKRSWRQRGATASQMRPEDIEQKNRLEAGAGTVKDFEEDVLESLRECRDPDAHQHLGFPIAFYKREVVEEGIANFRKRLGWDIHLLSDEEWIEMHPGLEKDLLYISGSHWNVFIRRSHEAEPLYVSPHLRLLRTHHRE